MLEIVEGGFNTQEINSAFDYDIVSSEDESVSSRITSSDESESGSDNDDVLVIPPTPKKRKMNQFVPINNSKSVPTCTKRVNQHVQGASGTNQSNICDLSQQPSLNTVSADNTSHYQITGQPDPSLEHDTEVAPEQNEDSNTSIELQENQFYIENTSTTPLQTPTIPLENLTTNLPHPQNHCENNLEIPFDDDYYIVEYDHTPSPPEIHLPTTQIVNCQGDTELQEDVQNGWHRITHDVPPNNPQFMDTPGLNFETDSCEPEEFFNQLFDHQMFTIMAEETNNYAHQQIARIMGGQDQIQQIEHHSHQRHTRLGTWRDINESDIKIFIPHILIMSSVRKPATIGQQKLCQELPFSEHISAETNFKTFCGIFMLQTQLTIHPQVCQTMILLPRFIHS